MAQVKTLTGQVTTLNLAFNSLDAAAQKTKVAMANAFAANVGSMGAFTTKMVQMKTSADQFGESIQKNRLTMTQYFKEAAVGLVRQDSLLKQYARQQVRYQQSVVTGMGAGPSGKPMAMIMTPKDIDIRNAATRMKVLNQEFNIFRTLVGQGATEMINFGKNTQWTGRQLTVGLTMPIVLFGATFAKVFMGIDKELTRFAKVYGEDLVNSNGKATEQMKQQVMDLAKTLSSTLGVAASETAGLAADVAATGKTGQDLLDTVTQTTRLAVLGEVDRQEAMKATLAIQSAFKQNTEELAESINFLNAIENQTSTTLNDLVEAIPKAGPVIKGLGGDIKDLSVLMVAMKEGGIPAAEAANAIKSGMASLINPTKKAADTAKEFGVNIEGIVKSNKGQLMPTIFALQSALNGLDDFSKSRVIEELFGKYQFARLSALFNNLGKAGSQTQQAMELAGASTVSLAAIANKELRAYTESTTIRFKRMVESIKNQLLPIGEALLEGLMPILKAASGIIETVGGFFEKIPDQGKGFLKFVGAITLLAGPALMLIGLFKQLVGNGIKAAMAIVTLGARLSGIKVGPLQHLDSETAAANAQVEILSNSFISQSTALSVLNKELANYRAGLQKLAYANPQMFTPPIGGRPSARPPIRRATGGDVPGGYGGGDKVPALLESGEFVVRKEAASKYRPILDAMNSGQIKGFVKGTPGERLAHLSPSRMVPISDVMGSATAGAQRLLQSMTDQGLTHVKMFNNLVISLNKTTNDALNTEKAGSGVRKSILMAELREKDRWALMMKAADVSFEQLQPTINAVTGAMDRLEGELINDPQMYKLVEAELRKLSGAGDIAAKRLISLSTQFGTFQYNRQDSNRPGRAPLGVTSAGIGSYKGSRLAAGAYAQEATFALSNSIDVGVRDALAMSSPSRETRRIGQQAGMAAGQGLVLGLQDGMNRSMGALDRIRMQMANMAPMPNSGPSSPYSPLAPGQAGAARMMEEARRLGIPGAKPSPVFLGMPTMPTRPTMPDLEEAGPKRSLAQGLMNKSGAMMNIGFMGSMVAGMASMNGEVSGATKALGVFTTAVMLAGSAMEMMRMFSGGGGGVKGAKGFMGLKGLGSAMDSRGAAMSAAGGARGAIGGGLARLAPMVIGAGGPIGIGVAAAITAAVGGFVLYKKAAGEARERADAAFKDPAKSAEYFGKTLKDVNTALKDIAASGAAEEIGGIDEGLRTAVAEDYATLIEKIKTTVTTTGASDLAAAYTKMLASGLSSEEAMESIKAIAVESGTAGGLAYSEAFAGGMLSAKTPEEAYKQMIDMINPNSQSNIDRVSALQTDRQNILANPGSLSRFGRGYSQEQVDQLDGITEALNISGEAFASTLQTAIELSQTSPEIVREQAGALKDAFTALNSSDFSFGFGQSEQEVAFDSFKNMMGELNDPKTNKVVDSLQNATTEAQGLAMELVSLGIPLTEAADSSGRFNEELANAAIESKKKIIDLNESIKDLNDEFNRTIGKGMRSAMEIGEKAYEKLLAKRERFDKTTAYQIGLINQGLNQQKKASESAVEGMESEIDSMEEKIKIKQEETENIVDGLNKEKEAIQKTTDKYLKSIQDKSQADTFYANQRKSNLGALGKLASGDVFGFLQDREAIAQEADSFAYDNQIKAIEDRRDAEIESIDETIKKKEEQTDKFVKAQQKQIDIVQKQIDLEQKAMDQAEEDAAKRIRLFEKIRKRDSEELDKQITKRLETTDKQKNISEGIKKGEIQSFTDVTEAYGVKIAEEYKIFAEDLIRRNFEKMKEEGKSTEDLKAYLNTRYKELFPDTQRTRVGMGSDQIAAALGLSFTDRSAYDVSGTSATDTGTTTSTSPSPAPNTDPTTSKTPFGTSPMGMLSGGYISGPGGPTEDKIPAMLSNGEYVVKASSVNKYGPQLLEAINMGYFAEGGLAEQNPGSPAYARFISQRQLGILPSRNKNKSGRTKNNSSTALTDGQAAVNYAEQQIGDPYSMTPNPQESWGCSTLTAWAYNVGTKNGTSRYNLPTYSESQASTIGNRIGRTSGTAGDGGTPSIPYNKFKIGDLVYFSNTGISPSGRHIGLYSGNGRMIHAGDPVGYSDLNSSWNKEHFTYGGTPKAKFSGGGYVGGMKANMFGMGGMARSMPRYAIGGRAESQKGIANISSPVYNININANGIQDPSYFANKVVNIITRKQSRTDHSRSVFS